MDTCAVELVTACEKTSFVGLASVETKQNKERVKQVFKNISDYLQNAELRHFAEVFTDVMNFQANEQEDLFEEVEKYRVRACNKYERYDFLAKIEGTTTNTKKPQAAGRGKQAKVKGKKEKYQKFPKATKNMLKGWLFDNKDFPYPNDDEKAYLCEITGVSIAQINQWFINGRRRILKMGNEGRGAGRPRKEFGCVRPVKRAPRVMHSEETNDPEFDDDESEEEEEPLNVEGPTPSSSDEPRLTTLCPIPPPMPYPTTLVQPNRPHTRSITQALSSNPPLLPPPIASASTGYVDYYKSYDFQDDEAAATADTTPAKRGPGRPRKATKNDDSEEFEPRRSKRTKRV